MSSSHPGAGLLLAAFLTFTASGQQNAPIGRTTAKEVQVSGAVEVHNGEMLLGNGSAITAGDQTVNISLTRGGALRLCATTSVHLSHDRSIEAQDSTALMMALDRGAMEANYETGKYSDVLLTPDLRILISGPGHADLKIRVNDRGDTCIDNHGANAPYVTVTSQMDGGLYRIQPNQHVTLERGGLHDVIDTETESCGCPAPPSAVADIGNSSHPTAAAVANPFPLAQSAGLAPPPPLPTTPVVPSGEVHAQASVPLYYNGEAPPVPPPAADQSANKPSSAETDGPASSPITPGATTPGAQQPDGAPSGAIAATPVQAPVKTGPGQRGFFHHIGHFFSSIFGGG